MGKLRCFEIILSDDKTVFHPGELVLGKVIVELKEDTKMRSLSIFMRGIAKVHWTEYRSSSSGSETKFYKDEYEYFFKQQDLFGGEASEGRDTLNEGRHELRFSFELPIRGISTSFEGEYGSIRYWLKAEINMPWSFNHRTKKAFTVISPININDSEYQVQVERSMEKSLCCWLCTTGPISISSHTDRRGYCPGESIAIFAEFDNRSSRSVIPNATLYQTQKFFAGVKSKVCRIKFPTLTGVPIAPQTTSGWESQLLNIPAVSPSICEPLLMTVDYYVKVALHIPGAHNLTVHLPIVIGTVPYRPTHPQCLTQQGFLQGPQAQFSEPASLPLPPAYRETVTPPPQFEDPPSYAESVTGPVVLTDEDDDDGTVSYNTADLNYTLMYNYVYNYHPPLPPPSPAALFHDV